MGGNDPRGSRSPKTGGVLGLGGGLYPRIQPLKLEVFDRYVEALGGIEGVHFLPALEGTYSNRWLTAVTLDAD